MIGVTILTVKPKAKEAAAAFCHDHTCSIGVGGPRPPCCCFSLKKQHLKALQRLEPLGHKASRLKWWKDPPSLGGRNHLPWRSERWKDSGKVEGSTPAKLEVVSSTLVAKVEGSTFPVDNKSNAVMAILAAINVSKSLDGRWFPEYSIHHSRNPRFHAFSLTRKGGRIHLPIRSGRHPANKGGRIHLPSECLWWKNPPPSHGGRVFDKASTFGILSK